jgi:hypothetical protein
LHAPRPDPARNVTSYGTSGGPFLANVHPATGPGAVLGVIGGYEQGGDTPSVSYSARFGQAVRDLYDQAVRKN